MKSEKDIEAIRVDLNKEDTEKFRKLQKKLSIQNKTDVIRFALNFTLKYFPNFMFDDNIQSPEAT